MKLSALACLLLSINLASSQKNCSYLDILNHLQLSTKSDMFTLIRPVKNHTTPTKVLLDVIIYAILDVREYDQTFVSYVWASIWWENEFISWDKDEFCGIESVALPTQSLWKPDLTIEEMTEKDKSTPSPFLLINSYGGVVYRNDQVVMSTCRMHVYKFPFDTQNCNLSYRSVLLADTEIKLSSYNSTETMQWTMEAMKAQYEWILINITVLNSTTEPFGYKQDMITYSILVKRRSVLYIVNFILPVLFFLFLDFASFLMPDTGGEKLGFKITVLLAVTVMQLLLNEILPASSDITPLIAVYCIGIFALMLLSLLETIVVLYLIHRDQNPDQDQSNPFRGLKDVISMTRGALPLDFTAEKDQVLDPALTTVLTHLLQNHKEDEGPGYWAKKCKTIHKVFFTCYFTTALAFLSTLFYLWTDPLSQADEGF